MALFATQEWSFAQKAMDLLTTNPFHPGWMEKQREVMGESAPNVGDVYAWQPGWGLWGPDTVYPNVVALSDQITEIGDRLRLRLREGAVASEQELALYETLSLYRLYREYGSQMDRWIDHAVRGSRQPKEPDAAPDEPPSPSVKEVWRRFLEDHKDLLHLEGRTFPLHFEPSHLFACFYLFRRAFYHIFFNIVGTSRPITRLRSSVWESIVTHDFRSWSRALYQRMHDFPTLITGPSGTGKELVAQAIGRSQYIPFNPVKQEFVTDFRTAFHAVNLSALPSLLIEAELFGHIKGSFAGAVRDRKGRLEECPEHGTVFLDEIGELPPEIQVKLLRVLQTRHFQSVGANEDRPFRGKIISATNRDLIAEMQAGRFREDFYYRLCADQIATPSLREQLTDRPEDLGLMVEFVCRSVVGEEQAPELAQEVVSWIHCHMHTYAWPGNFRELEQCVRSYAIRKDYHPIPHTPPDSLERACAPLAALLLTRKANLAESERMLFTLVRAGTSTDREAAEILHCDYRTLQARLKVPLPRSSEK